jgi:hypothetical protein
MWEFEAPQYTIVKTGKGHNLCRVAQTFAETAEALRLGGKLTGGG